MILKSNQNKLNTQNSNPNSSRPEFISNWNQIHTHSKNLTILSVVQCNFSDLLFPAFPPDPTVFPVTGFKTRSQKHPSRNMTPMGLPEFSLS